MTTKRQWTLCLLILSTTDTRSPLMQCDDRILSASSSHKLSFDKPLLSDLAAGSMSCSSFCRATASRRSFTSRSFNRRSSFSRCSVNSLAQFSASDWATADVCLNRASTPSASPSTFYNTNQLPLSSSSLSNNGNYNVPVIITCSLY